MNNPNPMGRDEAVAQWQFCETGWAGTTKWRDAPDKETADRWAAKVNAVEGYTAHIRPLYAHPPAAKPAEADYTDMAVGNSDPYAVGHHNGWNKGYRAGRAEALAQPAEAGKVRGLVEVVREYKKAVDQHLREGKTETAVVLFDADERLHETLLPFGSKKADKPDAAAREKTNPNGDRCLSYGVNGNGQAECYWPECSCYPVTPKQPDAVAGLVEKWRNMAQIHRNGRWPEEGSLADQLTVCANELAAALAQRGEG